ncbi:MAG: 6,7-dimethyl-8-ribityllumazine synthase [Crocinitomicaceae bacterium]|jgi:6,7-dimethyl-8-ribityllumazine synthase|nr:6,7-dimethyl-8-ribityllumazine synthase [Crocinitomicaceae bacterium]
MATSEKNLSEFNTNDIPNGADFRIGIVVSEWNGDITGNLLKGAVQTLESAGVKKENIVVKYVPGAFELPIGCQWLAENDEDLDGMIAIGCVIQGDTRHFDFVCSGATEGIMNVMLEYNIHISFCLLTDNTKEQSIDRSGGKHGNKGVEAAVSCLKMIALFDSL